MVLQEVLMIDRDMVKIIQRWGATYRNYREQTVEDKRIFNYIEKYLKETK